MAEPSALAATEADSMARSVEVATVTATVRYFAAARAAAGVPQESVRIPRTDVPSGRCTIGVLIDALIARHGADLARVLPRCSYLLDEVAVHGMDTELRDGQVLDVLPPFAGG